MTGREQATRFRAEQIEHWLEVARAAAARGVHEEVLKACQQVFVLDPDNATAVDLSDRARNATDERQIAEHVEQATDLLARGALDDASRIVKLALALDPASPAAIRTRLAIDEARRAREQEAARRRAIESAMQGAESAYSVSSYDTALRKLDEVLSIDRAHGRARSLRDEVLDAIEQRRRLREAEDKARATVAEAWEWYSRGDVQAAVALLEGATPSHELLANALGELRRLQEASAAGPSGLPAGGGTDFEKTVVIPVPAGGRGRPASGQPPTQSLPTIVGPAEKAQPVQAFDLDSTVLIQPLRIPPAKQAPADDAKTASSHPAATGPITPPATAPLTRPLTSAPHSESPVAVVPPPVPAAVPAPSTLGAKPPASAGPSGAPKKRGALIVVGILLVGALAAGGFMAWSRLRAPAPQPEEPVAAQPAQAIPPASPQPTPATTGPPAATPETQTGIVQTGIAEAAQAAAAAATAATPSTQPKRRKLPGSEPAPVTTPPPSEPVVPPPVTPVAPHAALVVESDTPGASVFVDGNPLGTAPLRSSSLSQGEHELRAVLEGEEDITKTIDIGTSGEVSVFLRFKEARLRASIPVVHKHGGGGSCEGKLSATLAGITYDTPNRNDAFSLTFSELERFQMDLPTKTLTVKRQGGRTWNFTDRNPKPDDLARFHFQVSRARQKLSAQGR